MGYLGNAPALAYTSFAKQDFTTSATTTYTLDNPVANANELALFINNVRQEPTTAYSASSTTLTLTEATSSSDDMYCVFLGKAVQTVNPPNNSVNEAQLNYPLTTFSSTGIDDNATSTAVTIDSSQNVGIGTNTPASLVHIDGTNPKITVGTSGSNVTFLQRVSDDFYIYNRESAGDLLIGTNDTERMRIDSSGRLLVGTTSTLLTSAEDVSVSGLSTFERSGTVANFNRINSEGTVISFYQADGLRGTISVGGSNTAYNTSSDYRLKENVNYDFDATSRLKELKPARFNFIADANTTVDGFLAHEVSEIVPEAITGIKDAVDADGNIEPQQIDQSKLVPLLVKTIQELEARITKLENN